MIFTEYPWNKRDYRRLHRLWNEGKSPDITARMMHQSSDSIVRQCQKSRLIRRQSKPVRHHKRISAPESATGISLRELRYGKDCCWPLWGDKDSVNFRMCGAAVFQPGASYCLEHQKIAIFGTNRVPLKMLDDKQLQKAIRPWLLGAKINRIARTVGASPKDIIHTMQMRGLRYGGALYLENTAR